MSERSDTQNRRVVIKKYANRRLYNTASSTYVTLDHLADMIKNGTDFSVFDARSNEDITRSVLTQIIVEEDAKGHGLLSVAFLRQLICFSGDALEAMVPRYLEKTMDALSRNKGYLRKHIQESLDGLFPFGPFDAKGGFDVAFFDALLTGQSDDTAQKPGASDSGAEFEQLREQLTHMQAQLDRLVRRAEEKA